MSDFDFRIYSDGGGTKQAGAGAACIVESAKTSRRRRVLVYYSSATNNEAEISAGLVGLSLLHNVVPAERLKSSHIEWLSDSEYTVLSARDYIHNWLRNGWRTAGKGAVKNQGLWKLYLELSRGLHLTLSHVRGHSGHPENEECDKACTWAQVSGHSFAREAKTGGVEIEVARTSGKWLLVNGDSCLEALRDDEPSEEALLGFRELLRQACGKAAAQEAEQTKTEDVQTRVESVGKYLQLALEAARDLPPSYAERAALEAQIEGALKSLSK